MFFWSQVMTDPTSNIDIEVDEYTPEVYLATNSPVLGALPNPLAGGYAAPASQLKKKKKNVVNCAISENSTFF